jgi:hypothetical protein
VWLARLVGYGIGSLAWPDPLPKSTLCLLNVSWECSVVKPAPQIYRARCTVVLQVGWQRSTSQAGCSYVYFIVWYATTATFTEFTYRVYYSEFTTKTLSWLLACSLTSNLKFTVQLQLGHESLPTNLQSTLLHHHHGKRGHCGM